MNIVFFFNKAHSLIAENSLKSIFNAGCPTLKGEKDFFNIIKWQWQEEVYKKYKWNQRITTK